MKKTHTFFSVFLALVLFISCGKTELNETPVQQYKSGQLTGDFIYENWIRPRLKGDSLLTYFDQQKCNPVAVNVDSLFSTGYYIWYENFSDGTYNEYEEGQLAQVRAANTFMRCDIYGYGGGRFWLDGDSANTSRQCGISHYPAESVMGADLYELYTWNGRHFVLRKNIATGRYLAFCSAANGNANEGATTGSVRAYFKTPDDLYFEANQFNTIGFSLSISDGTGATVVDQNSSTEYGVFLWRNQQTEETGWDYYQLWSVTELLVVVNVDIQGQQVGENVYSMTMRSQYLSNNGSQNNYIFQPDDPPLGEFKFYE